MAIRQEKNKKKWTKDGRSWFFDEYYFNEFGERKEYKSKLFKTDTIARRERKKWFLKQQNQNNAQNATQNQNNIVSFTQLFEEWLVYKRPLVKETSYYNIKKCLQKNVLPTFEKYKDINRIPSKAILSWKQRLFNSKEYSLSHQNKLIGYMNEILLYAVDMYDYEKKKLKSLTKYKISAKDRNNDSLWNFWTYEQFEVFISYVKTQNEYYYLIFNFLYWTGLRIGELVALTWNDLNFENKTLSIINNFTYNVEDKVYDIIDVKTENSVREIDLDDNLIELLKKHYESEKNIYNFSNEMFIFGNVKYLAQTTLRRWLKKFIEESSSKVITLHGFRHSHVSLLIHIGCDSRDVAIRIGDTVQEVEKTYYHMFPSKKRQTILAINNLKEEIVRGNYEVNGDMQQKNVDLQRFNN